MRCAEVHRCALNWHDLASGDIELITWGEIVSIYIKHHIIARLREVAAQVIIVVVGLINDGWLVGFCLPSHVECVVGSQFVSGYSHHLAGESVLAVGSHDGQLQDRVAHLLSIVNLMHPTGVTTAVQTVRTVVLLQTNGVFTKDELTILNTVSITTNA